MSAKEKTETTPTPREKMKLSFQIEETGYIIIARPHTSYQLPSPVSETKPNAPTFDRLSLLGAASTLGGTDLEAVLEAAVDDLQVSSSAATGGLSSLGLLAPVDCSKNRKLAATKIRIPQGKHC